MWATEMRRFQIQVGKKAYGALRKRALARRVSVEAVVRNLLESALAELPPRRFRLADFSFVGAASARVRSSVSEEHDMILGERAW